MSPHPYADDLAGACTPAHRSSFVSTGIFLPRQRLYTETAVPGGDAGNMRANAARQPYCYGKVGMHSAQVATKQFGAVILQEQQVFKRHRLDSDNHAAAMAEQQASPSLKPFLKRLGRSFM